MVIEESDEVGYRNLLGRFASGVVVVTGLPDGVPAGLACQSFFSLSLRPRLIALSPSKASSSWERIARTGRFAISILAVGQESLCRTFGRGGEHDKFLGAQWELSPHGSPLIRDALGWLDCEIEAVHDGGDHHLVVGRVLTAETGLEGTGLLFHHGTFGHFRRQPASKRDEATWDEGPWIEGLEN